MMVMMKIGKVGWVAVVVTLMVLNMSTTCSAWFGSSKNKNGGRKSMVLPGEEESTSGWVMNPVGSSCLPSSWQCLSCWVTITFNICRFYNVTVTLASHQGLISLMLTRVVTLLGSNVMPLVPIALRPSNDLVPCKDPIYASLQKIDDYNCEDPNQCDYELEYADHYSFLGVLVKDVFLLNFTNEIQLKVRMALGKMIRNENISDQTIFPASSYHPLDGMLGLGRGKSSLISQLNSQGLIRNVGWHCLSALGGGYIFFGNAYQSSRVNWIPMSSIDYKHYLAGPGELVFGGKRTGAGNLFAVFDAGSSYTYFNSQAYQALVSWVRDLYEHAVVLSVKLEDQDAFERDFF
ncbi:hypothetical protein RIF29_19451 [Crotalaria pallida]|uniref:Xylanase inhibitor N-terminal domain-containing protein n=1 Tax=Crotalaria pallida TaxID=3830 RepID=A0AAN9F1S1_CROPI